MNVKANLLIEKERNQALKKIRRFLFSGTAVLVVSLLVFGISLFAYLSLLKRQFREINSSLDFYNQRLALFSDVEKKKSIIAVKLNFLDKIYKNRPDFSSIVGGLQRIAPPTIRFETLKIGSDGEIEVTALGQTSAEIDDFVKNLRLDLTTGLSGISLVSLSRRKDGDYVITLKLAKQNNEKTK